MAEKKTEKKVEPKAKAEKAPAKKPAGKTVKVRLKAGLRGTTKVQRGTVAGLGLKKIGQVRELEDTACVRGMIRAIPHLVEVVE